MATLQSNFGTVGLGVFHAAAVLVNFAGWARIGTCVSGGHFEWSCVSTLHGKFLQCRATSVSSSFGDVLTPHKLLFDLKEDV
jgi:hypothetical protein